MDDYIRNIQETIQRDEAVTVFIGTGKCDVTDCDCEEQKEQNVDRIGDYWASNGLLMDVSIHKIPMRYDIQKVFQDLRYLGDTDNYLQMNNTIFAYDGAYWSAQLEETSWKIVPGRKTHRLTITYMGGTEVGLCDVHAQRLTYLPARKRDPQEPPKPEKEHEEEPERDPSETQNEPKRKFPPEPEEESPEKGPGKDPQMPKRLPPRTK